MVADEISTGLIANASVEKVAFAPEEVTGFSTFAVWTSIIALKSAIPIMSTEAETLLESTKPKLASYTSETASCAPIPFPFDFFSFFFICLNSIFSPLDLNLLVSSLIFSDSLKGTTEGVGETVAFAVGVGVGDSVSFAEGDEVAVSDGEGVGVPDATSSE